VKDVGGEYLFLTIKNVKSSFYRMPVAANFLLNNGCLLLSEQKGAIYFQNTGKINLNVNVTNVVSLRPQVCQIRTNIR